MAKELTSVVGVGIDPPFGGLVPFGKRSAFPHAVPSNDKLKKGDALILSFGAMVGGYNVECERSFCVGPAQRPREEACIDAMLAAHDTGAANMKEGMVAEEVDKMSLDQIRQAGFAQFLKHRTGHGIGLEGHEAPWIAEGDKTVLKVGMTFSCEPGVYDPGWGGFRHSDTVIVGKTQRRDHEPLSDAVERHDHHDLKAGFEFRKNAGVTCFERARLHGQPARNRETASNQEGFSLDMSSTTAGNTASAPSLKRALGLWDLVLYGIIVIQPTAPMPAYGAFSNAGKGHVVTAVLIAMVAMIFTAISYGRMARVYPSAGSAYTYVGREMHPSLGFVTGWSMTMDYMLNPLICTIWCGKAMADLIPEVPLPIWFVAFARAVHGDESARRGDLGAHQPGAVRGHGTGDPGVLRRHRALPPASSAAGRAVLHAAVL